VTKRPEVQIPQASFNFPPQNFNFLQSVQPTPAISFSTRFDPPSTRFIRSPSPTQLSAIPFLSAIPLPPARQFKPKVLINCISFSPPRFLFTIPPWNAKTRHVSEHFNYDSYITVKRY
jgi:hypothetical protein